MRIVPVSIGALLIVAGCFFLDNSFSHGPHSGFAQPSANSQASRPNVLFIVLDATRYDHLSCYGYKKPTTPNLDQVAAEGALYENCITPASWTLPSLASLFTGLYPRDHGVKSQHSKLKESFETLAEILAAAGYRTLGFSSNAWVGSFAGLDQGFEQFVDVWRHLGTNPADDGAALTNERIRDWLGADETGKPFFLFVHYFEPHFPYRPPPPYDSKFLPKGADSAMLAEVRRWAHPREVGYILKVPGMEISRTQLEILESQYDGEIAYLDRQIGILISEFKRRGLLDNTITVITSDHGEHLGDHALLDHKMSLYDPLIHVPLIIRYPPAVPAGRRIQSPVQTIDILPTLLQLCAIKRGAAGVSVGLPLADDADAGRSHMFAEFAAPNMFLDVMAKTFPEADHSVFDRALKVVQTRQYKLIWASDGRHELYDIVRDRVEAVNLYDSRPKLARELMNLLEAFNRGELPEK